MLEIIYLDKLQRTITENDVSLSRLLVESSCSGVFMTVFRHFRSLIIVDFLTFFFLSKLEGTLAGKSGEALITNMHLT